MKLFGGAFALVVVLSVLVLRTTAQFNNPPGVLIWCGKAYQAGNASFDPGGWLKSPRPSSQPLLDLRVRPRTSQYLVGEIEGSFVLDAPIQHLHGQPFLSSLADGETNASKVLDTLLIDILLDTGRPLVASANHSISMNSTGNEISFSLMNLTARTEPYNITVVASSRDGGQAFVATTQLYYLPVPPNGGSVTKLDSLYGGLQVQDYLKDSTVWQPLFPYSFYVSWGGWLVNDTLARTRLFKDLGYNIIHVVPPYDYDQFDMFLDECDRLGLWVMYDIRVSYRNNTLLTEQINRYKDRKSLLLWSTADEPDGNSDPLNATKIAYDTIKALDPYHPVSLVLNCANFYYENYTAGTDIVMSDPYPISINTTFSTQWNTLCNTTYGDCGCDNCNGTFEDTSARVDSFIQFEEWIGRPAKPFWAVPQSFGNETYWPRYPTAAEETVMDMLFINHGVKGSVRWIFPTTAALQNGTSALAKVLTNPDVMGMLLGAHPQLLTVTGKDRVDAAAWVIGSKVLVSVVSMEYSAFDGEISVALPQPLPGPSATNTVLWGPGGWRANAEGLVEIGIQGLEVSILMLDFGYGNGSVTVQIQADSIAAGFTGDQPIEMLSFG
ncbi:hypothetical protein LTS18_008101 [Coniosporium uncinatum]|uniref:Uncharacterized protein n=1 Tax=Coniosporium uncinatum TaxID=93489 RepID=A0ACC3DWW5_9PEZI|nr:hypothetical protein LTS18_008101 [Coniosporium uncinatum]